MTSFTEKTWTMIIFAKEMQDLMDSYVKYPPRPMQSEVYTGPTTITRFRTIEQAKKFMKQKQIELPDIH